MTCPVVIVGFPPAASCPPEKTWRAAAGRVARRLHARFGDAVAVAYADFLSPEIGAHGDVEARIAAGGLVPPVVMVDGAILSSGGKLNVSAIERAVAAALAGPVGVGTDG